MPEGSSSENQAPMIKPVAYQASPLEEFDFSKPTEWIKWIKRFERFRSASGLSKRDEESQLNTLLYFMGSKSDDILTTFGLTTDNSKKYDVAKDKLDGYFVKRRILSLNVKNFTDVSEKPVSRLIPLSLTYMALPNIVNLVCYTTK